MSGSNVRNSLGWSAAPTETGWYWIYSQHDPEPTIVHVTDDSDGEFLVADTKGQYVAVRDMPFRTRWKLIEQEQIPE